MKKGVLLLLFVLGVQVFTCGVEINTCHQTISPEYKVTTLSSDTISLGYIFEKGILLLINDYTCTGCKESVFDYLNSVAWDTGQARFYAIGRVGNNDMGKRVIRTYIQERLPGLTDVFFDIQEGNDPYPPIDVKGGLFEQFGISRTPVLLLINNSTGYHKLISYQEMYNGTSISAYCRQQVRDFLNG
ncbi:MAG: hypothetical protein M3Q97_09495 [Bacteroidota bacterium]|nr:hypothetical protein [Bacteroidota bacterium]